MSSTTVIGIPTDDKVFERNCIPLFAGLLGDPNVKLVGTRGKAQFGLDLIGKRDRDPAQPVGIQCKLITKGDKLREAVVRADVQMALAVQPPLTEFYVVTTAADEPALDLLAISLSQEQAALGRRVDIQVWGWDTLQEKIRNDGRALAAFDPDYSASTDRLIALGTETVQSQSRLIAQNEQLIQSVEIIRASVALGPVDTQRSDALELHLDALVDEYRDLMNAGKPRTALDLLGKLASKLDDTASVAIRARIKVNIAYAHLKLGGTVAGADLLAEAYDLNPSDPKARANNILALALRGDIPGAWTFAQTLLADDPTNSAAASLVFQVAAMADTTLDPLSIVPDVALDDLAVRIHRICYLREKGAAKSWWQLAAETLARFPEDGSAIRMAGDALIEDGLGGGPLDKSPSLPLAKRSRLMNGAALLQGHWDIVRHYENAADINWVGVAINLINAYRALGDQRAQTISEQMLAIGHAEPGARLAAAWVAIDRDGFEEAVRLLIPNPDGDAAIALMVAQSNLQEWAAVLEVGTPERRDTITPAGRPLFDILVFRARRAVDTSFDLDHEVEALLDAWPLSTAAHIAVSEAYFTDRPDDLAAMAAKTKSLIDENSSYADRVMFAQLSAFREAWDDIIAVLDGWVPVDRPSEPLAWLAHAYANAAVRPRTSAFYRSIAPEVMTLPRYSRLAGAAEHNRGDLSAAERHLRATIASDPQDLRAHLLLNSTLRRANRESDATGALLGIDEQKLHGSPEDRMRLAHMLRRAGETERALRLGYRIAAHNRQNEDVMSSYSALIFVDENLPAPVGRPGPAQSHFWFDLEGLEGVRDVDGIIDDDTVPEVTTFSPSHALAKQLDGKSVGDVIVLQADVGGDRRYRIRALKHKYIWLLHDIMATHAARFPHATSLVEMRVKDGDVQPVLEMVKGLRERDDVLSRSYADFPVPLAAVATMARQSVLALMDHLRTTGTCLRTCAGSLEEREEAARFVMAARGKGAVLDTLTLWLLRELGHLSAAKAYFGRLCIPQSTFDEIIEIRAKHEASRGREYMTVGFEGDQAWRRVHTPQDTENMIASLNEAVSDIEANCDILPVDGSDPKLDKLMGTFAARQVSDPIHLAKAEGLILISEDLNFRQLAAQSQVIGGAWLQVVMHVMASEGAVTEQDFLIATGLFGAMLHDHVWLDAGVMVGILTLKDERALALYKASLRFIGGPKAEMTSHLIVTSGFVRAVWAVDLPDWQKGRAIGLLLDQLTRSRPHDWKAVLHMLDRELDIRRRHGDLLAQRAREYLADWIVGHFHSLDDIRSADSIVAEFEAARPMKRAKKAKARRRA